MKKWNFFLVSLALLTLFCSTPVFAQFYETTAEKDTAVGAATLSNSVADYATMLMNDLIKSCGRYVNADKNYCIAAIPEATAVKDVLIRSTNTNYNLQCVGFAEAVSVGVNADFGSRDACLFVGYHDSSWQWIPNSGNATLQVGDVPIWCGYNPFYQHIAVVTDVVGGGYEFTVAEANGGSGSILFDKGYSISNQSYWYEPNGWLRKK